MNTEERIKVIIKEIYKKVKNIKSAEPLEVILKAMEIVEKIKGLSGEEKKSVVILSVTHINNDLNIVAPDNLSSIIDAICFAAKNHHRINVKSIISKIKGIFKKCNCFKAQAE